MWEHDSEAPRKREFGFWLLLPKLHFALKSHRCIQYTTLPSYQWLPLLSYLPF